MCRCVCVQYVSLLRPPKMIHGDSCRNGDAGGPMEGRRRVRSLTNHSSASTQRSVSPRRSLHNLSVNNGVSGSVEDELRKRHRLAGLDQAYGDIKTAESGSEPGFGVGIGGHGHEWKQVSDSFCIHFLFKSVKNIFDFQKNKMSRCFFL